MTDETVDPQALETLEKKWLESWPNALAVWSKYTKLRAPTLCTCTTQAQAEGLEGSFAMIRLEDQSVVISLPDIVSFGLQEYSVEVLAHEVGHHVLAPNNLTDHARLIARMRWALPTVEHFAPMIANLYTDLLINDRLQRSAELRLADIYGKLKAESSSGVVWALYMRIYEILWNLKKGVLVGGTIEDRLEGDAWLGTRVLRSYAREWLDGAGRFAALFLPHLLEDQKSIELIDHWADTKHAGHGGSIDGLTSEEPGERQGAIHPALDPALNGELDGEVTASEAQDERLPAASEQNRPCGQAREPFQYGEILRAAGLNLSDHEVAVRYYREAARPHITQFPSRYRPESTDPLPEGLDPWDIGHPLDDVDWMQSTLVSPEVIPGMTTVQRVWGTTQGNQPRKEPVDLDLYVDSSGSMANPQRHISYPALAGAIMCLSALRAGAKVQATLWSGKHQFTTTKGFIRDGDTILRVLTGYFGGATAFPIHILRDTYQEWKASDRGVHILHISDDGIASMFDEKDERGNSGWDIAAMALERAGAGGSLVLNMAPNWEKHGHRSYDTIKRGRDVMGWRVHCVRSWNELVEFARAFSRLRFGDDQEDGPK